MTRCPLTWNSPSCVCCPGNPLNCMFTDKKRWSFKLKISNKQKQKENLTEDRHCVAFWPSVLVYLKIKAKLTCRIYFMESSDYIY